jgi:rare lipoprotein A
MATLRTGTPAPAPSLVRVASARPFVPEMATSAGRPVRGEIPMPQDRPYTLGNTPADLASVGATSEISASSRSHGRTGPNLRSVSYDETGNYAAASAPRAAYAPDTGADEAREILSGRGLY